MSLLDGYEIYGSLGFLEVGLFLAEKACGGILHK